LDRVNVELDRVNILHSNLIFQTLKKLDCYPFQLFSSSFSYIIR